MTHDAKLRLQEIQLRIAHNLHTGKMHYAGWRLAWDETSELVSLNAVAGKSTRSQQGSSWQVCVCHVTFFWGDLDGAQFFSCVTPPLPLLSNGAQHLDNALCGHPLMMPIQKFKQWMTEYAEFSSTCTRQMLTQPMIVCTTSGGRMSPQTRSQVCRPWSTA